MQCPPVIINTVIIIIIIIISSSSSSSSSRTYRLTWQKLRLLLGHGTEITGRKIKRDGKDLVNKNVLSCLLKDGKEVNALISIVVEFVLISASSLCLVVLLLNADILFVFDAVMSSTTSCSTRSQLRQ